MADYLNIAGRVRTTANDGVTAEAQEIKDLRKEKFQETINQETDEHLATIDSDLNAPSSGLKSRVTTLENQVSFDGDFEAENTPQGIISESGKIATANAVRGAIDVKTGYFTCNTIAATADKVITAPGYVLTVGGAIKIKMVERNLANDATLNINATGAKPLFYNGARAGLGNTWDAGEIVEVFYDGTNYQANNIAGNAGDGVFDISVYHSEGSPTSYGSLADALGTNGGNVPQSRRKGGMTIRYIDQTTNKYVEYRLMSATWSTNVGDWQGVDDEPTAGSENLVKSGGVQAYVGNYSKLVSITSTNSIIDIIPDFQAKTGDKLHLKVVPKGAVWSRLALFSGDSWGSTSFKQDYIEADIWYDATLSNDISGIKLYVINMTNVGDVEVIIIKSDTLAYKANMLEKGNVSASNIADGALDIRKFTEGQVPILARAVTFPGYSIRYNTQAYSNVPTSKFAPIPVGTTIKNNGVYTILGSDESLTSRKDLINGETWVATFEVQRVQTSSQAGEINLDVFYKTDKIADNAVTTDKIADNAVTTDKIADNAVTLSKLSFTSSVNLIDRNKARIGYYISSNGNLGPNNTYNTTDYIPIEAGCSYRLRSTDHTPSIRMLCIYDANKNVSRYMENVSLTTVITAQEGEAFIRITFYASEWQYAQFTKGSAPVPYQDYKLTIPSSLISEENSEEEKEVFFFLPKHIFVADGRTIEIYYDQIILNAHLFNIQAVCPIGKSLERKFQIVGDTAHVGNTYTLTLSVYDHIGKLIVSDTSSIHIVSDTISAAKNILPIGDSLTNLKPWLNELHTLSENLTTVGTRNNQHEGRSGATVSTYTNVTGGIVYSYNDGEYRGPGYGTAPDFSDSESYAAGTIVKTPYSTGYRYWIFKQDHAAGSFVENEVFCLSDGNPFYDYVNERFSMSFYKTFYSKVYDAIILYLGTNGISLAPETNLNGALGIKNLINLIREDEPTIPIIVVNTIFRSSQNGIGNQGNTDGYIAQSEYKFNADRKVLLLAKAINELCGEMANVYLCPVGATHDSKYNFGNTKVQVNPRISSTETVFELNPSDSVHPQNSGYMQMADEIFSALCYVFNRQ